MAKPPARLAPIHVECPCCQSSLQIDISTGAVLTYTPKEKPKIFEDFSSAVKSYEGEAARRDNAFEKSLAEHKVHKDVLNRKFEELFKKAKEDPDSPPPPRPFDLD